jgi:hypothetical protein
MLRFQYSIIIIISIIISIIPITITINETKCVYLM